MDTQTSHADTGSPAARDFDWPALLADIHAHVAPRVGEGRVADYIPALACVPADRFGMAVVTVHGDVHAVGDATEAFSVQSIAKVYSLTQALNAVGPALWERVGREPSGNSFNSLVQLERESGIPRNPFINAGALVLADVLLEAHGERAGEVFLDFVRERAGNPDIAYDPEVAASERAHGHRNAAMVNFMRSFDNIHGDVEAVLDLYFKQCSLRMSCRDLARSVLYLADRGHCPHSGSAVVGAERAKRINAVMLTCGTYDAAGDFAFHVGLPAKSGVGGGIVAVIPKVAAVAVWSPALDEKGNSLAGGIALDRLTEVTGLSVF